MAETKPASSKAAAMKRVSSSFRLHSPSLNSIRLRRIFDMFDKNGDGMITVEELNLALEMLGLEAEATEIESMVVSYIRPGEAGLAYEDFQAFHTLLNETFFGKAIENGCDGDGDDDGSSSSESSSSQEEEDLTEAFKVFDEDGDGFISAMELQVVLRKLGMPEGRDMGRVERMIFSVDRNHDGRVDFYEFKDMMHGIAVRS